MAVDRADEDAARNAQRLVLDRGQEFARGQYLAALDRATDHDPAVRPGCPGRGAGGARPRRGSGGGRSSRGEADDALVRSGRLARRQGAGRRRRGHDRPRPRGRARRRSAGAAQPDDRRQAWGPLDCGRAGIDDHARRARTGRDQPRGRRLVRWRALRRAARRTQQARRAHLFQRQLAEPRALLVPVDRSPVGQGNLPREVLCDGGLCRGIERPVSPRTRQPRNRHEHVRMDARHPLRHLPLHLCRRSLRTDGVR